MLIKLSIILFSNYLLCSQILPIIPRFMLDLMLMALETALISCFKNAKLPFSAIFTKEHELIDCRFKV